ncbi:hypothetical protein HW132_29175 [Brasilonema sp. CT11]|nr:hypothetical protein [Brasilonema sp. CT11]
MGETTAGATTGRQLFGGSFPRKRALETPTPDACDGKPVYGTKCHAARTALAPQRTASPRRATAAGGFPDRGMWRPRWLTYDS